MKTLITYYSYSGHTDKVINIMAEALRKKGEVKIQRLKPKDEIKSFLGQCMAARAGKRAELEGEVTFDASPYDLVIIGSPVWACLPVPSVNTYLDKLSSLNGKKAAIVLTSGSGLGVKGCFKHIRNILEAKGASRIDEVNVPDRKLSDDAFISSSIEKVL